MSPQPHDPRLVPIYSVTEAAHHVRLPRSTVKDWVKGRTYPVKEGTVASPAILRLDGEVESLLSFRNLTELHVLSLLRRRKGLRLDTIRDAITKLGEWLETEHPLYDQQLFTDRRDVFIDTMGQLLNVTKEQAEMRSVVDRYLERVERDPAGVPRRLFPWTRTEMGGHADPKAVAIDPTCRFGRPFLIGAGVETTVIDSRFRAGESIEDLAADYRVDTSAIQEAVRFEHAAAA